MTRDAHGWEATWIDSMRAGAAAGVLATTAMSVGMVGLKRTGFLGRLPPIIIFERALSKWGVPRQLSPVSRRAGGVIAHFAFGALQGTIYALGLRLLRRPAPLDPTYATGVPFAMGVWALSYAGWIPALGLMRPPAKDRPGRPTSMILAHVVYGVVLVKALRIQAEQLR